MMKEHFRNYVMNQRQYSSNQVTSFQAEIENLSFLKKSFNSYKDSLQ